MKPIIISHRGNNFAFPENTLVGLRSSFELGCTAVEFDIQMTNDETLVVMHDDNTLRTSGIDQSVLNSSYQELASVSVHEPKRLGSTHQPTPISKLDEVMGLLNEFPIKTFLSFYFGAGSSRMVGSGSTAAAASGIGLSS